MVEVSASFDFFAGPGWRNRGKMGFELIRRSRRFSVKVLARTLLRITTQDLKMYLASHDQDLPMLDLADVLLTQF